MAANDPKRSLIFLASADSGWANRLDVMRYLLPIVFLAFCQSMAFGAEDINPWDYSWGIQVSTGSCTLSRKFSNKKAQEAKHIHGTEQQVFDRFSISFSIPNDTREYGGKTFVANEMYFSIRTDKYPMVSETQQRVESARIGDIELCKHLYLETANFRYFLALGDAARSVFDHLENAEDVTIIFGLSNGTTESVPVPSSADDRFTVWSKLLLTCAEVNTNLSKTGGQLAN